jgi:hypothetical protein
MESHADTPPNGPPSPTETMEERLRRLEDALANLQDTHTVEQRIVERVSERLTPPAAPAAAPPAPAPAAERRTPPAPGLQLPFPLSPSTLSALPGAMHQAWLLLDLWNELRAMVRMFFDRRYRVAWTTRLTALILIPMILLSHFWMPKLLMDIPIAGQIIDKVVDLILAFFLYKGLSREAARYRQALAAAGLPL